MGADQRLDLGRIDVESGADDHLLGATYDEKDVVLETGEVAGVEPAILVDRLRGEVGCAVVTTHHVRATHVEFADVAIGDKRAVLSNDPRLQAWQEFSNRIVVAGR